MTSGARLGVLGGTFDPIHFGHLATAAAARDTLRLDRVLLVPSRMPPHRPQQAASRYHRFAMAALAVDGYDRLEASDIELLSAGPSYTADTLGRLHAEGADPRNIFFITGADAFAEIATWSRYPHVLDLANFVVVSRPGRDAAATVTAIPAAAARFSTDADATASGPRICAIPAKTPDVSSTEIRRRRRDGLPIDGLVPDAVARHIYRHRLYTLDAPAGAPLAADHLHGQD